MCSVLEKLYYLKLLYKKQHLVARMMMTIIIIFSQKIINFLNINSIEIHNLTNFVISVILKRKVSQIAILKHQRKTSARMQK